MEVSLRFALQRYMIFLFTQRKNGEKNIEFYADGESSRARPGLTLLITLFFVPLFPKQYIIYIIEFKDLILIDIPLLSLQIFCLMA